MKNIILLLVFLTALLPPSTFGSKKIKEIRLKGVHGEAIGTAHESLNEVKQRAISQAKINALKKAGIEENISAYTDFFQSETSEDYEELFSSTIFTNIQGAVSDVKVEDMKRSFTEDDMLQVQVSINCTVIKYLTKKDVSFDFKVEGIRPNYNQNELLDFQFIPYQKGYLKVFLFTKDESYQLFPNDYESSRVFQKGTSYSFPLEEINYRLETDKRAHAHRAVFVFMKKDIPYLEEVEYEQIFNWIFSIPPDLRQVKSYSFTVFNAEVQ